jgi:hypothetical protein
LCDDLREGVIENVITAFTADYYKDILPFDSLQHLTNGQHKNSVAQAQTHILQCIGFILLNQNIVTKTDDVFATAMKVIGLITER